MSKRALSVIIIEDEDSALKRLKRELANVENLEVNILAEFETVRDTVEWVKKNLSPDLAFMDIQLADGVSFEIFDRVLVPFPVIFTTAYDEYAVQAFQVNSLDYLLKPIDSESLSGAIDKYFKSRSIEEQQAQFEHLQSVITKLHPKDYRKSFLVYFKQKMMLIDVSSISYFYIRERLVHIVTNEGKVYPLDQSLEEVEVQLDPAHFYRANRQFLVAKSAIKEIEPYFTGRLLLHLSPKFEEAVTISKEKVSDFKQWADR